MRWEPVEEKRLNPESDETEPSHSAEWRPAGPNFKAVPATKALREAARKAAAAAVAKLGRDKPPNRDALFSLASELPPSLGLDASHIGFLMLALHNEYWRPAFDATPFSKRLLLLPQCLRAADRCAAKIDATQLHCQACGLCPLGEFQASARRLGWQVLIAEGTPTVLNLLAVGKADAVLGVACLNVLERAFDRVAAMGVPALAFPLLRDDCRDTALDDDWLWAALECRGDAVQTPQGFIALLRETTRWFDEQALIESLHGLCLDDATARETERIALAWARQGGKRLRPFVLAAAWRAFAQTETIPLHVRRLAVAVEFFHKASLVHDDVEDDETLRYGQPALHRRYSIPLAVNLGDYLLGLGYRLATEAAYGGTPQAANLILAKFAKAHVRLAEGQGMELLWRQSPGVPPSPGNVLRMYALKTAPAFEAALFAGVAAAGSAEPYAEIINDFAKHLGVAYQIRNDLEDFRGGLPGRERKESAGNDFAAAHPTVLWALTVEAASEAERTDLLSAAANRRADGLRRLGMELCEKYNVPKRVETLGRQQRDRALAVADKAENQDFRALLRFLCSVALD